MARASCSSFLPVSALPKAVHGGDVFFWHELDIMETSTSTCLVSTLSSPFSTGFHGISPIFSPNAFRSVRRSCARKKNGFSGRRQDTCMR
jgi:hypothetical protein